MKINTYEFNKTKTPKTAEAVYDPLQLHFHAPSEH